jgi:M6 family metalloprotease-like protein
MKLERSVKVAIVVAIFSLGIVGSFYTLGANTPIGPGKKYNQAGTDYTGPDYLKPPENYATLEGLLFQEGLVKKIVGHPPPPVPVSGPREILVILAECSDVAHNASHDQNFFWDRFFDTNPPSVRNYFTEVSYNNFWWIEAQHTTPAVVGWYTTTKTQAQFLADPRSFVAEAITLADANVDFSLYDDDSNGNITDNELTIFVIASGNQGGAHHWWTVNPVNTGDGVTVDGEYAKTHEDMYLVTYCHELGHFLGLPDLYDTTPTSGSDSEGIGNYGLMGAGNWTSSHMEAWSKWMLGWLTPTVITTSGYYDVHDLETHPEAYILVDASHSITEYFMIENRDPASSPNYENLGGPSGPYPDSGIAIYHIDETMLHDWWFHNTNNVNGIEEHKAVDVENADRPTSHVINADHLDDQTNRGDATDLWDINEYDFYDSSTPCNAHWYDGTPSGMDVRDFPVVSATMRVHLSLPGAALLSSLSASPTQVSSGQQINVTMAVENVGGTQTDNVTPSALTVNTSGTASATYLSGPNPASATITAGSTQNFTWAYVANSGASGGTVTFTGNASGTENGTGNPISSSASTSNTVTIQVPASLNASLNTNLAVISSGQSVTVNMVVSNTGQATANGVTPSALSMSTTGTASATYVNGPAPGSSNISGGTSITFSWTYTGNSGASGGTVTFSGNASGTDAKSGNTVVSNTPSATITVQTPANLVSSLVASPASVFLGNTITVSMIVQNIGQAGANNVTPSALTISGDGIIDFLLGPVPASVTIPGLSSQTFTWTFKAMGIGIVAFSGNASGTDTNSGLTVTSPLTTSNIVVIKNFPSTNAVSQLRPLSQTHISQAQDLLKQADDLLAQAKAQGRDTGTCEKLMNEAEGLLTMAKAVSTNPIYANNLALQAIEKLKQALDCLKALIG